MHAIYLFFICILILFCIFLCIKLYKFSIIILSIEEALEESLDLLNERYGKMNEVLQKPVFFDSVEVRQVIADIKDSHNALIIVANKLTNDIGLKGEIKEKINIKEINTEK